MLVHVRQLAEYRTAKHVATAWREYSHPLIFSRYRRIADSAQRQTGKRQPTQLEIRDIDKLDGAAHAIAARVGDQHADLPRAWPRQLDLKGDAQAVL